MKKTKQQFVITFQINEMVYRSGERTFTFDKDGGNLYKHVETSEPNAFEKALNLAKKEITEYNNNRVRATLTLKDITPYN